MKESFLGDTIPTALEFTGINQLLKKSGFGIACQDETKQRAVEMLKDLQLLGGFKRLIKLIEILQILSQSQDYTLLNQEDGHYLWIYSFTLS